MGYRSIANRKVPRFVKLLSVGLITVLLASSTQSQASFLGLGSLFWKKTLPQWWKFLKETQVPDINFGLVVKPPPSPGNINEKVIKRLDDVIAAASHPLREVPEVPQGCFSKAESDYDSCLAMAKNFPNGRWSGYPACQVSTGQCEFTSFMWIDQCDSNHKLDLAACSVEFLADGLGILMPSIPFGPDELSTYYWFKKLFN